VLNERKYFFVTGFCSFIGGTVVSLLVLLIFMTRRLQTLMKTNTAIVMDIGGTKLNLALFRMIK